MQDTSPWMLFHSLLRTIKNRCKSDHSVTNTIPITSVNTPEKINDTPEWIVDTTSNTCLFRKSVLDNNDSSETFKFVEFETKILSKNSNVVKVS